MIDPTTLLIPAIAAAGSAGAAWGAVKMSLNGTRARVKTIEDILKDHLRDEMAAYEVANERLMVSNDRLSRLETKIDLLLTGQIALSVHRE